MDGVTPGRAGGSRHDQTFGISPRARARCAWAVGRSLAPLGLAAGPALDSLCAELLADAPIASGPRACVGHARDRLDCWLAELARQHLPAVTITPEMRHAALLAIEPGRHWPAALLSDAPPQALIDALWRALPLSLPPDAPLAMPAQSFAGGNEIARSAFVLPRVPGILARRLFVFGPTFLSTIAAAWVMERVFSPGGISAVEVLLIALFTINFVWIALTFWTGLLGLMMSGRSGLPRGLAAPDTAAPLPKTAILVPTYNEDPSRIFAALEAIHDSLRATGQLAQFDFFVLSDSTNPDAWIKEEVLWDRTRERLRATGHLYYRRRFENTARKAGNVAEFCQRWGGNYEAMLVLDADSLMEGATIVEMVRIMAANPAVGLLQTVPQVVNRNTLFARAQQFACRLYGPVLARGLAAWHGSDGNYWGHNALIRIRAFAAHAGMPTLPGSAPFGGHILSHDFVEAALMRRAGWGVYMLSELGGSYEESPPSLLDHAQRDRRWCQGNLQHLAVIGAAGLHPLSRFHLLTGIMSYLASPLWFAFLVVGVLAALQTRFELPQYFFPNRTPYPVWHVIDPELATRLFVATMLILLAPKFFGWLAVVLRGGAREFGGQFRLFGNLLLETLISALTAPVQMLFQSRFVYEVLRGHDSGWKTQTRDEHGVAWRDAWQRHKHHTTAGIVMGIAAYAVAPPLAAWMAPALLGMLLATAISYVGSRLLLGQKAQRMGLLLIPEEIRVPAIVTAASNLVATASVPAWPWSALRAVITDDRLGSLHLALLSQYAPREVTAPIALAYYRAHHLHRGDALEAVIPAQLEAAALASSETLIRLRRRAVMHGALTAP